MHMREFELALRELLVLRDLAPDEANVWFLLGKCWKGLGEKGEALRAFTTALNLDVKVSLIIYLPRYSFMTTELTINLAGFALHQGSNGKLGRRRRNGQRRRLVATSQKELFSQQMHSITVLRFSIGRKGSMGSTASLSFHGSLPPHHA